MKKDELIDIGEIKLPNVILTKEQKTKIRKSFKKNLTRFNENNYMLPIDSSLENIKKIEKILGNKKMIYYTESNMLGC